jgi:NAD(P)-dependent dehydrogenase (short-subunit alcohol dehydrogenase family)
MHRLDGQVAIVTGAGTGIGQATAVALAGAGATLAVVGRREGPLEETVAAVSARGGSSFAAPVDVTDAGAVEELLAEVTRRCGRLDVLVNNAGVNVPRRDMSSVTVADWTAVLQASLTGTFLMAHAALPLMRRQRSGTIINVSSMAGMHASALTGPAYNAAKAGVNSLTESLNLGERRHGIRSCAICPGEVSTPILEHRPEPPTAQARATMLQPEDVAATVLFVAALPQRATVELLSVFPTEQRDWTAELRQSRPDESVPRP